MAGCPGIHGKRPGVRFLRPAAGLPPSPCLPAPPPCYFLSSSVSVWRPQAWEPQAACPVLPSSGMSPREGWPPASQTLSPARSPSPHLMVPPGTPSFYSKALTVTQGPAPDTPTHPRPKLRLPPKKARSSPGHRPRTGAGGRGWGTWRLDARAPATPTPVAKVEPSAGPR